MCSPHKVRVVQSSHLMRTVVIESDLLDVIPEILTFKVNLLFLALP